MRKVILILLSLLTANFVMYSQNEDIKPIVVKEKTTQGTKENHAPAKVQVECFYYSYTNSLELSFLSNLGTVDVVLENQTTGELQNYAREQCFRKDGNPCRAGYRLQNGHHNGERA